MIKNTGSKGRQLLYFELHIFKKTEVFSNNQKLMLIPAEGMNGNWFTRSKFTRSK